MSLRYAHSSGATKQLQELFRVILYRQKGVVNIRGSL